MGAWDCRCCCFPSRIETSRQPAPLAARKTHPSPAQVVAAGRIGLAGTQRSEPAEPLNQDHAGPVGEAVQRIVDEHALLVSGNLAAMLEQETKSLQALSSAMARSSAGRYPAG